MKCLKNQKTGNIIRVPDQQADQMAGLTWKYIAKSEWKSTVRTPATEQQEEQADKREKTVSEKSLKRQKLKAKQRQ